MITTDCIYNHKKYERLCEKLKTSNGLSSISKHELELKILKQISELNKVRQNREEKLKLEIINKIFDDFPVLVPTYFKDVFSKIQSS